LEDAMADLLERGSRWLEDQRTKHCTRDVTYVRGAASAVVRATVGRTEFKTDDGETVRIEFTDRDFLILATELVLSGNPTLPERGDKVWETQDGTVYVFEVMDWRYSDPYRQTLRIETKLVGTETV
jgi:hypothetical protein